jgi:hypothetical protein
MGADFSIKPVGAPVAAPFVQPAPEAAREAVPTQLPAGKTVSASDSASQAALSASNSQQVDSDRISRQVLMDQDAGAIVYVSVDKDTNLVVSQFPDESRLRARAYFRAQDNAKQQDRRLETDRTV